MIIVEYDEKGIITVKSLLKHHFNMTNLGSLTCFLGIEVAYNKSKHLLSQFKFINNLIYKLGIIDEKIVETSEVLEIKIKYTNIIFGKILLNINNLLEHCLM